MQALDRAGPNVKNVQLYPWLIFSLRETLWNVNFNQELDFSYNVNNYFVIKEKNLGGRWQMGASDKELGGRSSVSGNGEITQGQFMCENMNPINLPEPTGLKTKSFTEMYNSLAKLTTGLI